MFDEEKIESRNVDSALQLLEDGWTPIALVPGEKAMSVVPWGEYREREITADELRTQFAGQPDAGIGLVLKQGVFRLDLDGRNARALLKSKGVELPASAPTLRTGRADGGEHVYLRASVSLPQLAGEKPLCSTDTGRSPSAVEVRVNDLAPVPPTIHPSGRPYEWIVPLGTPEEVPEAPASLLELIAERIKQIGAEQAQRAQPGGQQRWVTDVLRGVNQGERDMQATKLAGYLFRKDLPPDVVREIMLAMSERCDPPLAPSDVDRIVKSIGRKHPEAGALDDATHPGVYWHRDAILEHARKRTKPGGDQWACPLPLPGLNRVLRGGLKAGRLYFLGGEPGMGKTALIIACAHCTAQQGLRVLIVSAEMPRDAVYDREIAMHANLDVGDVEDGRADEAALIRAGTDLATLDIAIANEAVGCIGDIDAVVKEVHPNLVIVDYLQLMSHAEKGHNPRERVEALSRGLKRLSKRYECAVLCVSSLRRGDRSKRNAMPTNADLRESGALEFDADGIMLLGMDGNERLAEITKNRFGPTHKVAVTFQGSRMTFTELLDADSTSNDELRRFGEADEDALEEMDLF